MPTLGSPIGPRARDNKVVLGADPDGAAHIRRMLADLWFEVRASDGDRPSFHRVCLSNLIVAGPRSIQQNLESFSAAFASAHPSRVIMAIVDPDAGEMTASISASCQRTPSGGDVVCWRNISIVVPPSSDATLTSIIRALLVGRVATVAVLALSSEDWPLLLEGVRRWGDLLVSDLNRAAALGFLLWARIVHC
jgi:hypothetical protein